MLYMMLDKGHSAIKVGTTKHIENRMYKYATENPFAICRATMQGAYKNEKKIHAKLEELALYRVYKKVLGIQLKQTEWFVVDKETFNGLYKYGFNYLLDSPSSTQQFKEC